MKHRGIVAPGRELPLSTVYRFLHCHNLMRRDGGAPEDRRRYESELPNDMWQSDVMHGPMVTVGDRTKKSYLIAFIDDHSRLIPHGEFYLSERLTSFLDAFEKALLKRGLPRKLYVDNGSAFRSKHLEHITASLGIALIHSRPYKPEGRGKIERFFRTVRGDVLAGFTGTTMEELNESFDRWCNETYHQRKHTSTGESPFKRFAAHMECVRTAPETLRDYFRKVARR
ncbi:MAG: transposase, partial [Deltaproteobacteria bacterium]|nr:transposase [Deltaproteobacteria bacterium]